MVHINNIHHPLLKTFHYLTHELFSIKLLEYCLNYCAYKFKWNEVQLTGSKCGKVCADQCILRTWLSHSSIIDIVVTSVVYFIEDDQCWPWGETTRCHDLITPGVMSHGSQIQEGVSSRTKRREIQEPATCWVCTWSFSNISICPHKYLLISKAWSLVMVVLQK